MPKAEPVANNVYWLGSLSLYNLNILPVQLSVFNLLLLCDSSSKHGERNEVLR